LAIQSGWSKESRLFIVFFQFFLLSLDVKYCQAPVFQVKHS